MVATVFRDKADRAAHMVLNTVDTMADRLVADRDKLDRDSKALVDHKDLAAHEAMVTALKPALVLDRMVRLPETAAHRNRREARK